MGIVFHKVNSEHNLRNQAAAAGCKSINDMTSIPQHIEYMLEEARNCKCLLVLDYYAYVEFSEFIRRMIKAGRGSQLGLYLYHKRTGTFAITQEFADEHGITLFQLSESEQAIAWLAS